jgi:hypothetical protein
LMNAALTRSARATTARTTSPDTSAPRGIQPHDLVSAPPRRNRPLSRRIPDHRRHRSHFPAINLQHADRAAATTIGPRRGLPMTCRSVRDCLHETLRQRILLVDDWKHWQPNDMFRRGRTPR